MWKKCYNLIESVLKAKQMLAGHPHQAVIEKGSHIFETIPQYVYLMT